MNFGRLLLVSSSHLLKRTIAAPASVENSHLWKKRKMFEELLENRRATRVKKTLNALRRREKEYGVSITQADLVRWAKRLQKDGKYQQAYEMFEWMEGKKMTFSPSELATFVRLIEKTKDLCAAFDYLEKADPDF